METFDNIQSEQQTIYRVSPYNSHDQTQFRAIVQVHSYTSFFPDLAKNTFSNSDILKTEQLFKEKFGQDIKIKKTHLDTKTGFSPLQWGASDEEYYLANILDELLHQNPNPTIPLQAIEDVMFLTNIEKQKKIDKFFQVFTQCSKQLAT